MLNLGDEFLGIEEASGLLRVHPMTLRQWIWRHWVPSIRIGPKLIRVYKIDIIALRHKLISIEAPRGGSVARSFSFPSRRV
jgi:excisionase family DNA binding protein